MASMLACSTFSGVAVRVQSAPKRSAARRPLSVCAATKKTPAPPASRFAAKAAPAESAVAMVCGECGYVYAGPKAFASQPSSYKCPVCKAPKSAFSEKDVGAVNTFIPIIAAIVLAAAAGGFYLSKL